MRYVTLRILCFVCVCADGLGRVYRVYSDCRFNFTKVLCTVYRLGRDDTNGMEDRAEEL